MVDGDHRNHGKLCICEGLGDDLCNKDFFKEDPNSGTRVADSLAIVMILFKLIQESLI